VVCPVDVVELVSAMELTDEDLIRIVSSGCRFGICGPCSCCYWLIAASGLRSDGGIVLSRGSSWSPCMIVSIELLNNLSHANTPIA